MSTPPMPVWWPQRRGLTFTTGTITMNDWNAFKGAAKRIDDEDLPRLGAMIGVGEDELHAFLEAETAGTGFDRQGRPKMLFEPHIFYRHLAGSERERAVREGLAYAKWKPGSYPADSFPRITAAMAINETAALKAASWGLAQVLGENHEAAGYGTVQEMVRAFMEDEEAHLLAAVNFIKANNLDDDLREHRWAAFARGYNGPGYRANRYDEKLAKAYAKWSKIKDTPAGPVADLEITNPAHIRRIQTMLYDKGYVMVGRADGDIGPATRDAVTVFQRQNGLPIDGRMTAALEGQIKAAPQREVAPARANATKADIADAPTVKRSGTIEKLGGGAILAGGSMIVERLTNGDISADQIDRAVSTVAAGRRLMDAVFSFGLPALVVVGGGLLIYFGRGIIAEQLAKFRAGNHV